MKNELRKEFLKRRREMPANEQLEKSDIIFEKLISLDEYKKADYVFCYIDMGAEVRTTKFIEKAWADGKKVAVPIAKPERLMYFVEITSFTGMQRTKLGVMEPKVSIDEQVFPTDSTMFIVPGSIFDEQKNRCGYGGGYYDTYTSRHNVKGTIGICYDMQVIKEIPVEPFDRKLNKIITEKRIIE